MNYAAYETHFRDEPRAHATRADTGTASPREGGNWHRIATPLLAVSGWMGFVVAAFGLGIAFHVAAPVAPDLGTAMVVGGCVSGLLSFVALRLLTRYTAAGVPAGVPAGASR